ncbi:MAG: hypothetical protein ACRD3L_16035 [Terriglobales bacterium]
MAATSAGVAMEFESQFESRRTPYTQDRRTRYPKPGLSPRAFRSLLMCFPITCMLWAAIIYGAVKLAQ